MPLFSASRRMKRGASRRKAQNQAPPGYAHQRYAYRPWQCLNFLPEPHGHTSLRPTLPQLVGSLGLRAALALVLAPALRAIVATASDIAISSSPVAGLM